MKKTYIYIGVGILVLAILAAFAFAYQRTRQMGAESVFSGTPVAYICAQDKTISAVFGDGGVQLTLSDGRTLTLTQAVSGSGMRYEAGDAVFIGKGDDAFLEEAGTTTYADCVANAAPSSDVEGVREFTDSSGTFSFSYPAAFSVTGGGASYTQEWMQGSPSLGLVLAKVSVPQSFMPNTNFSDARLTVGTSADPAAQEECLTAPEGPSVERAETTIHDVAYTRFRYADAGAGNFYETTSYRTMQGNQCYVIEYTIHSTNINNYPPERGITEFDHERAVAALESVVRSFQLYGGK